MEQTYDNIQRLSKLPNRSTYQLQQIRRADLVITSQMTALGNAKAHTDKLAGDYMKLLKLTKEAKRRASGSAKADNVDYVLQHTAELVDQQLRVLEKTLEIVEENKKL